MIYPVDSVIQPLNNWGQMVKIREDGCNEFAYVKYLPSLDTGHVTISQSDKRLSCVDKVRLFMHLRLLPNCDELQTKY